MCWFTLLTSTLSAQYSLRFYGGGVNAPDADRAKIMIDDVTNNLPGPPADVGAEDFTIEFWLKGDLSNNTAGSISCGSNINWIYGNIVLDRDRYGQDRKYGLSLGAGIVAFGVSGEGTGDLTICGSTSVLDGNWHHIAVQRRRSDGYMWLFVDGMLEAQGNGPDGDVSYPDDGIPCSSCCGGNDCNFSDPYLVLAAEKHDAGSSFPSFNGSLDELRLSNNLRYATNFSPSTTPFATDANTVALYHFDEGSGSTLTDVSGAVGGPSPGVINYGGNPQGPVWANDTPFSCAGSINMWVNTNPANWNGNVSSWSLMQFPTACDEVQINSGEVSILTGNVGVARQLSIAQGVVFTVSLGGSLDIGQ